MTTTIGSVTLDYDMVWVDEYEHHTVEASVTPTIGGGQVVQEFSVAESGRPITLQSTDTVGPQTKATVDALKALAEVANATYALTISNGGESVSKTVRFRNEEDGGPVQFSHVVETNALGKSTYWYLGKIMLAVV